MVIMNMQQLVKWEFAEQSQVLGGPAPPPTYFIRHESATLRDVCSFIQLHSDGEWRGCSLLDDML
jgi:hypothetical protein